MPSDRWIVVDAITEKLERAPWRTTVGIPSGIRPLIDEHIATMCAVLPAVVGRWIRVRKLERRRIRDIVDALNYVVLSPGASDESCVDRVFAATFPNAIIREPIVWSILSWAGWSDDPVVRDLPNPWGPVLKLMELGHPVNHDDRREGSTLHVDLCVGHAKGIETFPIL